MIYDYNRIKEKTDEIFEDIVNIRREIHSHPELSEHEENTAVTIQKELDRLGIPYVKDVAGHGIYATIYGKNREHAVGIRADIDALPIVEKTESTFKSQNPGVMHACGHDIHTAVLLGTARILNEIKDQLPGSVRLIFQPSEETIGGAFQMIQEGALKNPETGHVIGLHVEPAVPCGSVELVPGTMNAASCEFYITVKGETTHGAHPDRGTDALLPACTIVNSLQSVITRRLDPAETALITVGQFHSGTKNNIVSGEAKFSGIIRTLNLHTRTFIKKELKHMAESIAESYGASCEVEYQDSYPSLENNPELFDFVKEECTNLLGADKVEIHPQPSLGADDFAYFCHESKGLYYNIGTRRPDEEDAYPIHSEYFNPDERCIRIGIMTEIANVMRILEEESKNW